MQGRTKVNFPVGFIAEGLEWRWHRQFCQKRGKICNIFSSSKRSKAFADFVGISFLLSILPTPTIRSPLLPFLPISWDSRRQVVGIVYLPNLITKPLQLQKTTKNSPWAEKTLPAPATKKSPPIFTNFVRTRSDQFPRSAKCWDFLNFDLLLRIWNTFILT